MAGTVAWLESGNSVTNFVLANAVPSERSIP